MNDMEDFFNFIYFSIPNTKALHLNLKYKPSQHSCIQWFVKPVCFCHCQHFLIKFLLNTSAPLAAQVMRCPNETLKLTWVLLALFDWRLQLNSRDEKLILIIPKKTFTVRVSMVSVLPFQLYDPSNIRDTLPQIPF